jgi:lipid II:glycine glycyltransferase (peptidoglycan interpeptide bridge formation enzyme)
MYTYLYGASDHEFRDYMSPLLLQWTAVARAKAAGATQYDFFGIAPPRESRNVNRESRELYEYDPKHQYAGVTRFKLGFGGSVVEAPGTFDLILQPGKYKVYQLLRKLRRLV